MRIKFVGVCLALLVGCPAFAEETPTWQRGIVAADHPAASQAGLEMLKQNGNAVDAAVATSFALSVVRPGSCGIGGGGFMVIWLAKEQRAVVLDYRERAPLAGHREMYLNDQPEDASRNGPLAVGVPGTVAGLIEAQRRFGKLELKTVLAPAIRLCEEGIPVDGYQRSEQKTMLGRFEQNPEWKQKYAALYQQYLNNGVVWPEGAVWRSPQLAVLRRIAEQGRDGFYGGEVAEAIVAEMQRGGGLITAKDLELQAPVERKPLLGQFDDLQVITMPPPSSGGTALLQMLEMVEAWEAAHPDQKPHTGKHNSPEYIHLLTECMKHAFADRAKYLGDTDFVQVPIEKLISREYTQALVKTISPDQTKPTNAYGSVALGDDSGTSHLSVMDEQGNAVACTETVNTLFGSLVVEPKFGIVLNNEMDDFTAVPGQPNAFGLVQSENNTVQPRKKPLSSMTPTIAVRDGKAVLAVGASGGPRIITATLEVFLNRVRHGMSPLAAVSAPRFHHQWLPDELLLETELAKQDQSPLKQKGHQIQRTSGLAVVQLVVRTPQGFQGASDPRKQGYPAGW